MKAKKKNALTIILVAIVAYAIGAYCGFPLAQMGLTSGNIGKANKQQELVNSPADVKLVEKFETDTAYLHKMLVSYGMLFVQTEATVNTVETLKGKMGSVYEFKAYEAPMNEVLEIGTQLSKMLKEGMQGLQNVADKKPVTDLSVNLSQALNLFQLMNSKLAELDAFNAKAGDLAKQKKLNNELVRLCSDFMTETAYIATSCGDNVRAANNLGMRMNPESLNCFLSAATTPTRAGLKTPAETKIGTGGSTFKKQIQHETMNELAKMQNGTLQKAKKIDPSQMGGGGCGQASTKSIVTDLMSMAVSEPILPK
jgi:hypothetical protein